MFFITSTSDGYFNQIQPYSFKIESDNTFDDFTVDEKMDLPDGYVLSTGHRDIAQGSKIF